MCGKAFAHYEPGWLPIRELVAAAVAYAQSRRVLLISATVPRRAAENYLFELGLEQTIMY